MQQKSSERSLYASEVKSDVRNVLDDVVSIFPVPNVNPEEMSNDTLAYLGDAVFNLYAKLYVLADAKVQKVHSVATMLVSRQGQSKILSNILNLLDEKEKEVVRRGINSKGARKHGNDRQYMESTGLETLIGYLYLIDKERLSFLLKEGMAAWKEV